MGEADAGFNGGHRGWGAGFGRLLATDRGRGRAFGGAHQGLEGRLVSGEKGVVPCRRCPRRQGTTMAKAAKRPPVGCRTAVVVQDWLMGARTRPETCSTWE